MVVELVECLDEHLEHGDGLELLHLLLDEETQLLDGLFGVVDHEVLHVEFENILVLAALLLDDLQGQLADDLFFSGIFLQCQYSQFNVLFKPGLIVNLVLDQQCVHDIQNQLLGCCNVAQNLFEQLIVSFLGDFHHDVEHYRFQVLARGQNVDVFQQVCVQ